MFLANKDPTNISIPKINNQTKKNKFSIKKVKRNKLTKQELDRDQKKGTLDIT